MNAFFDKILLEEPKLRSGAFRHGFLAFTVGLTIFSAIAATHLSPSTHGRYYGFIVPPLLLLSHLAFHFRWSRSLQIGLRVGAVVWSGVVLAYTFNVVVTN